MDNQFESGNDDLNRIRQEAARRKKELEQLQREELRIIQERERQKNQGKGNGYSPEKDSAFAQPEIRLPGSEGYQDSSQINPGSAFYNEGGDIGTVTAQSGNGNPGTAQTRNGNPGTTQSRNNNSGTAQTRDDSHIKVPRRNPYDNNPYDNNPYENNSYDDNPYENQQNNRQRKKGQTEKGEKKVIQEPVVKKTRTRAFDPDQAVSDEEFISSYEDDGYDSHDDYDYDREEKSSRKRSSEKTSGRSHDRHDDRHRDSRHSDDGDGKKPKRKKKNPVVKFFGRLIFILLIIFLIFGLAIGNVTKRFKHIDTEVSKRPGAMKKGVVNVLLIGQDARDGESGQRTDSIILMSINTKKNNVSMTSIMRDTYVDIPGYGGDRINAAYVYGGIDLLDQTIEENFDITIDGNAMVDFDGFLEAMTAVGDLDIALTAEEAEYMNANPGFGSNNDASDEVWNLTEGVNSLTPNQLLAYSRIRYIGNSDWDRTERQRKVISAAVSRVKHGHFISGYQMATKAAPSITTDIKTWGMMRVAFGILTGGEMKSHIIPVEDTYYGDYIDGMDVLVPDLEQNKAYLQKYINGEE